MNKVKGQLTNIFVTKITSESFILSFSIKFGSKKNDGFWHLKRVGKLELLLLLLIDCFFFQFYNIFRLYFFRFEEGHLIFFDCV